MHEMKKMYVMKNDLN